MRTVKCSAEALPGLIEADMVRLDRRVKRGLVAAARGGMGAIRPNIPKAFGELADSLHLETERALAGIVRIILDAPHACAVEEGSRPHTPPLEPLLAWVRLRGMQGLTPRGKVRPLHSAADPEHETSYYVATAIAARKAHGATPVDAAEQIARAIQHSISVHGTKPHWMVRSSLAQIAEILGVELGNAVHGDD